MAANTMEEKEQEIRKRKYMKEALRQARKAVSLGEVPIGCVIVYQDQIIGRGYNRRKADKTVLAHAEISAIKKACKKMGDWRLEDCEMYVTLEPCQMCAGAIVQARIKKVYIGAPNPKAGCAGSILNLFNEPRFNHIVEMETGLMEEECSAILTGFFKDLRAANKELKNRRAAEEELETQQAAEEESKAQQAAEEEVKTSRAAEEEA